MKFLSRRDFLKVLTDALLVLSGLLGLGGLLRFMGYTGKAEPPPSGAGQQGLHNGRDVLVAGD